MAQKARDLMRRQRRPFRYVVNEALRHGLDRLEVGEASKPYRTEPRPMGLKKGLDLDNIAELLSRIDEEERR